MPRLWIFGDSYSGNHIEGTADLLDKQWHRVLAQELNMDYENRAVGGSSVDYSKTVWFNSLDEMRSGDLAVIAVTSTVRRWFFPKYSGGVATHPYIFNNNNIKRNGVINERELEAVKLYFQYLYHTGAEESGLYNWVCALNHIATSRGIQTIILSLNSSSLMCSWQDQFPDIHIAKGDLRDISSNEHVERLRDCKLLYDGRANHLTLLNHQVLLSKLLAHYRDGVDIDLTEGFHENVINARNLKDPKLFISTHRIDISLFKV